MRERATDISFLLLRIVAGFLFFQAGATKVFGWYGGVPTGQPPLLSQLGIGGVIEVVGGIMIIVGLLTRPMAFILSGQMAVAYWQFHAPHGTWPTQNHGVPAVLFCFLFLFMAAYGAGPYAIDARIRARLDAKT